MGELCAEQAGRQVLKALLQDQRLAHQALWEIDDKTLHIILTVGPQYSGAPVRRKQVHWVPQRGS